MARVGASRREGGREDVEEEEARRRWKGKVFGERRETQGAYVVRHGSRTMETDPFRI